MGKEPVLKYFYHELSVKFCFGTLAVFGLISSPVFADDAPETETESKSAVSERTTVPPEATSEKKESSPTDTLGFNLRIDTSYSGGGSVYQGFSVPSVRLSGFGNIGRHLNYRLSLGQTKEFSTASLAQILPVEAYIVFNVNPIESDSSSNLRFKAGLFSPTFNPIWTPDLSYLNIPDFNETHRALFLSREAGAELIYEPFKKWLEVGAGAFNGTGIFAQNTNNAKAFTVFLKLNVQMQSWLFSIGTGDYILKQATEGSVNYKSAWVSDVFLTVEVPSLKAQLTLDAFTSQFEDSVRGINPVGGSALINFGINKWLGFFGRYEYATKSPVLGGCIRQLQIGPEIYFDDNVKSFITYSHQEVGGAEDRTLMVRLRLNI
jgi:hypothetical protein